MSTEVTKANPQLPAFLENDIGLGQDEIKNFIVPPRLKIVQPLSGDPYKGRFAPGTAVLSPQLIAVANILPGNPPVGAPFHFIPVFMYPEWMTINPHEMKGSLDFIRERSFDARGEIARKSRNKDTRQQPCPENSKLQITHKEFLNFIVVLQGTGGTAGIPIAISWSGGDHRAGSSFCGLVSMRRDSNGNQYPLPAMIFEAQVRERKNSKGDYFGLDVTNPAATSEYSGGYVTDAAQYAQLKQFHLDMKAAYERNALIVNPEDEEFDAESRPAM